jgi:hypothetical protein
LPIGGVDDRVRPDLENQRFDLGAATDVDVVGMDTGRRRGVVVGGNDLVVREADQLASEVQRR